MADAVNEFAGCLLSPEDCDRGLVINVGFTSTSQRGGMTIAERGEQRLNRYEALTHTRYCENRGGGDFGRARVQAELLAIVHLEVAEDSQVARVLDALRSRHTTDFTMPPLVRQWLELAAVKRHLVVAQTETVGVVSVGILTEEANGPTADEAADGAIW